MVSPVSDGRTWFCLTSCDKFVAFYQEIGDTFVCRIESGENIEDNKRNLMMLTQKVFDVIVASSER